MNIDLFLLKNADIDIWDMDGEASLFHQIYLLKSVDVQNPLEIHDVIKAFEILNLKFIEWLKGDIFRSE